jgi:DNA-binding XRE family transcriptional regulator
VDVSSARGESCRDGRRPQAVRREPPQAPHPAGLSQEALAELCDLHRTEISLLERSKRSPRLETIVILARGLQLTSPADLLESIS